VLAAEAAAFARHELGELMLRLNFAARVLSAFPSSSEIRRASSSRCLSMRRAASSSTLPRLGAGVLRHFGHASWPSEPRS